VDYVLEDPERAQRRADGSVIADEALSQGGTKRRTAP
jgi:hypothetical protein